MQPGRQQTVSVLTGALAGATLAAIFAVLLAPSPLTATIYLGVGSFAGVALLVAGLGARHHGLVLITFLVVLGSLTLDFAPLPVYRYLLVSDVLLVSAGVIAWMTGSSMRMPALVMVAFCLWIGNMLVSFLRSRHPDDGYFTFLHLVFLGLFYIPLVSTALGTRREFPRYAFAGVMLSGVVQSLLLLLAIAQGLHWQSGARIMGALGNYSLYIFAICVIGAAVMLISGTGWMRIAALAAALPIVPAMLVTRSRSTWVAAIVGVVLALIVLPKRKVLGVVASTIFAVALVAGYAFELYPGPIQDRITRTLAINESKDLIFRMEAVYQMWPYIEESPLVGIGLNQSPRYLPARLVYSSVPSVHNIFLHAAVEVGLFAVIGLLMLPIAVLGLWWRAVDLTHGDEGSRRLVHWAFICFISIYVGVQFTPAMYEHAAYFTIAFLASFVDHPRDAIAAAAGRTAPAMARPPVEIASAPAALPSSQVPS